MLSASPVFVAVGANLHAGAADWRQRRGDGNSLFAFGAGRNVAVCGDGERVTQMLSGHSGGVNAVKILAWEGQNGAVLVSGGSDRTLRIWAEDEERKEFRERQCVADAHAGSINALAGLESEELVVSGAADGTVQVWDLKGGRARLAQTIELKPKYLPLALALTGFDTGEVVLAVAGTTSAVQIYLRPAASAATAKGEFKLQATLTGHEGWIRSLDFTSESGLEGSDVLLASASQDRYIRLWRFRKMSVAECEPRSNGITKKSLSNQAQTVARHSVTFEALLVGHEDWIYSARWKPTPAPDHAPTLLSASADNSLAIWGADAASGLWVCTSRLGEISAQKGSTTATGSTGGFWNGLWSPEGDGVASLGRTGSWRRWKHDASADAWTQHPAQTGHGAEVRALAWSPHGEYLLSAAADQTTRAWAEWQRRGEDGAVSWHELSRPQIHGYDLNCLAAVSDDRFVSGADEKLLRVFDKPRAVARLQSSFAGRAASPTLASPRSQLPDAAGIPLLGLSNKATEEHAGTSSDSVPAPLPLPLHRPPLEDDLSRRTLWPEHEKLYGHGYEISAVACSPSGTLVATACRASAFDHAGIRVYSASTWRELPCGPLRIHTLTVTALAFSPHNDGVLLLSVGRDRQWAVFHRTETGTHDYALRVSHPTAHARMILDCAWAPPSSTSISTIPVFATAGRDRVVKLWRLVSSEPGFVCIATIRASAPVSAVEFAPRVRSCSEKGGERVLLAFGTDQGVVSLVELQTAEGEGEGEVAERWELERERGGFAQTVTCLTWRPGRSEDGSLQLAVGGEDGSVRVYGVEW